jgi:hypothetical protein
MSKAGRMKLVGPSTRELLCGSFRIIYAFPGAYEPGRAYNMQIWPGRRLDDGRMVSEDKVANVDWNDRDEVTIISYRSGKWENELLSLLEDDTNVPFFG